MWEYTITQAPDEGLNLKQEIEMLNLMGKSGWELVQVLNFPAGDENESQAFDYYWKRKIEINEKLREAQLKEDQPNDKSESSPDTG